MLDPNIFDTKVLTPDLMNRKVVKLRRCRRALVQVEEKWFNLILHSSTIYRYSSNLDPETELNKLERVR